MTIDNRCGQEDQNDYPGSQAEAHSQIALEQSALYATKLAIARWITTSSEAATAIKPAADLARGTWYAEAQRNFQEWLGMGGFSQYEIESAELAEPVLWSNTASAATPLASTSIISAPTCID